MPGGSYFFPTQAVWKTVDPLFNLLLQSEENPQETFDTRTDYTVIGLTGIKLPHSAYICI